jgi:hypothetical protein
MFSRQTSPAASSSLVSLSGMPDCKFAINDKFTLQRNREGEIEKSINIDDLKFDRCVKLSKFDRENAITFTPPDGKFTLMTYRVSPATSLCPSRSCASTTELHAHQAEHTSNQGSGRSSTPSSSLRTWSCRFPPRRTCSTLSSTSAKGKGQIRARQEGQSCGDSRSSTARPTVTHQDRRRRVQRRDMEIGTEAPTEVWNSASR